MNFEEFERNLGRNIKLPYENMDGYCRIGSIQTENRYLTYFVEKNSIEISVLKLDKLNIPYSISDILYDIDIDSVENPEIHYLMNDQQTNIIKMLHKIHIMTNLDIVLKLQYNENEDIHDDEYYVYYKL